MRGHKGIGQLSCPIPLVNDLISPHCATTCKFLFTNVTWGVRTTVCVGVIFELEAIWLTTPHLWNCERKKILHGLSDFYKSDYPRKTAGPDRKPTNPKRLHLFCILSHWNQICLSDVSQRGLWDHLAAQEKSRGSSLCSSVWQTRLNI